MSEPLQDGKPGSWDGYLDMNPEHPENKLKEDKVVSREELEALAELKEFIRDTAVEREKKARYKIEILFGDKRTPLGQPNGNAAVICIYESGRRLHGGGDELVYWCDIRDIGAGAVLEFDPDRLKKRSGPSLGCGAPITADHIAHASIPTKDGEVASVKRAICPHCKMAWDASQLTGQIYGRWTTKNLAKKLTQLWRKTGGDADIYLKYHYTDIRYKAMESAHGTETARNLRGAVIYPLQNIIKDTSGGADVEGRFYVFLQQ
jgi:hypothetical protein